MGTEKAVDPTGPHEGADRVLRGGSWVNEGRNARSARRLAGGPGYRDDVISFRLARGQAPGE